MSKFESIKSGDISDRSIWKEVAPWGRKPTKVDKKEKVRKCRNAGCKYHCSKEPNGCMTNIPIEWCNGKIVLD